LDQHSGSSRAIVNAGFARFASNEIDKHRRDTRRHYQPQKLFSFQDVKPEDVKAERKPAAKED
jgi:hypothetical protein